MNTWLSRQMLGIFPAVTKPVYLISSPRFPDLNIKVSGNRMFRISAIGLDGEFYVQRVEYQRQTTDQELVRA
jgi:putative alpha-1,2-mannosidase